MACDPKSRADILRRVLELSVKQTEFLKDNRFVELLVCQEERDALMAAFDGVEPEALRVDNELVGLASMILENDRLLSLNASTTSAELKEKLCRFGKSKKAIRAYTSR